MRRLNMKFKKGIIIHTMAQTVAAVLFLVILALNYTGLYHTIQAQPHYSYGYFASCYGPGVFIYRAQSSSVIFLLIFLLCFLIQAVLLRSKKMNLYFLVLFLVICIQQYLPFFIAMFTLEEEARGMQTFCFAITNSVFINI